MYSNILLNKLADWGADVETALDRFMGNEELYIKFILKFLENAEMEKLIEALGKTDYEDAITQAHTLKGVTGNLGIVPLFDGFAKIVNDMRAGEFGGVGECFENIKIKYDEVCKIISENK